MVGGGGERPYSFMGVSGSPIARILSRVVTDHADSSLHGGATHDVRFVPETWGGGVIKSMTDCGRGGERRNAATGGPANRAYSKDVGKWARIARNLDPGNFDALLVHCHYVNEGAFQIERPGEHGGDGHPHGEGGTPVKTTAGEARERASSEAILEFFRTARLTDKTSWYNAAVAAQMLHEAEPHRFGVTRKRRLAKLGAVVGMLISNGDACPVLWGSQEDADAARKFAGAILSSIREAEGGGEEKIPFTKPDSSRIISP